MKKLKGSLLVHKNGVSIKMGSGLAISSVKWGQVLQYYNSMLYYGFRQSLIPLSGIQYLIPKVFLSVALLLKIREEFEYGFPHKITLVKIVIYYLSVPDYHVQIDRSGSVSVTRFYPIQFLLYGF